MAWLGIATAVGVSWWSHEIIGLFFGRQYEGAGPVLALHTWTSVFVFLGFASSNWFVAEGLQKYSFYRTAAGAVINVGMNYILIPIYGILGAAAATLFSQFVASYFFNAFSRETRGIFKMQTLALVKVFFLIDLLKFVFFRKKK
jgi:O-antigen/teichoic acid export membrane protein